MNQRRKSLKERCFPRMGRPDMALVARLRRGLGPITLREVLLGVFDSDETWREFCLDLLRAQPPNLRERLLKVLRRARRVLAGGGLGADVADAVHLHMYDGCEDIRALQQRLAQGGTSLKACEVMVTRLEWRLRQRAAAILLTAFDDPEADAELEEVLHSSDGTNRTEIAAALLTAPAGIERLRRAIEKAPPGAIKVLVEAGTGEHRRALRAAATARIDALAEEADRASLELLAAATEFLPLHALISLCLKQLGRYRLGDEPLARAIETLQAAGPEAAAAWLSYLQVCLVIERHLEALAEAAGGEPALAGMEADASVLCMMRDLHPGTQTQEHVWSIHVRTQANLAQAGPPDEAQIIAAARHAIGAAFPCPVLRLRTAYQAVLLVLVRYALAICGEQAAPALIHGLGAEHSYVGCFNALVHLQERALRHLADGLRAHPDLAGSIVRLAERIENGRLTTCMARAAIEALPRTNGSSRTELALYLARRKYRPLESLLGDLLRSHEPRERAVGAYCVSRLGASSHIPALIVLLLDAYHEVRDETRLALLRYPHPQQVIHHLSRAARSRSAVLQLSALDLLAEIGDVSLRPFLKQLRRECPHLADVVRDVSRRVAGAPFDPGSLPARPVAILPQALRTPRWRTYWRQLCRQPDMFNLFHRFNQTGMITDEEYFQLRRHALEGRAGCRAFLQDVINDYLASLCEAFGRYHGLQIDEDLWQRAADEAVQTVDEQYLEQAWHRGRSDLVFADECTQHAMFALRWQMEECLLRSFEGQIGQARPDGFPALPDQDPVVAEWLWLSTHANLYWSYDVRPRVGLAELAAYAAANWRVLRQKRFSPQVKTVREIVDYLAIMATVSPCPRTWQEQCKEHLAECFEPFRQRAERYWRKASLQRDGDSRLDRFGALWDDLFSHAVADYDAFWSGPSEPILPVGMALMRSAPAKLPKHVHGRGVPFAFFLGRRVREVLGEDAVGTALSLDDAPELAEPEEEDNAEEAETSEAQAKDATEESGEAEESSEPGFRPDLLEDADGRKWLSIRDLAQRTGLSEKVLRTEESRGAIAFTRVQGIRAVPWVPETVDRLVEELQARAVLRQTGLLAQRFGVSQKTVTRQITKLREALTAAQCVAALRRRYPPRDEVDD